MLTLLLLSVGCAPRPLLARAIRARGGSLSGLVRQLEVDVYAAVAPGTWHWRTAFLAPDRFAWTIYTSHGPDHYVVDEGVAHVFSGEREVAAAHAASGALGAQAEFAAVVNLDALTLPGAHVAPLAADGLPDGVAAGLAVALGGGGTPFRLGFDAHGLLVWASGPVDLSPLGRGELVARFSGFRPVDRWLLSHRTAYTFAGAPLADERTLSVCPDDPGLVPTAFATPARLPACPP